MQVAAQVTLSWALSILTAKIPAVIIIAIICVFPALCPSGAVMRELGRNMAWLLKCIELGKANGITHPENPRRPMTNFIR